MNFGYLKLYIGGKLVDAISGKKRLSFALQMRK